MVQASRATHEQCMTTIDPKPHKGGVGGKERDSKNNSKIMLDLTLAYGEYHTYDTIRYKGNKRVSSHCLMSLALAISIALPIPGSTAQLAVQQHTFPPRDLLFCCKAVESEVKSFT
jgi:hypothetical protein